MSYYTVEVRRIDVIGRIWLPPIMAVMTYHLTPYDLECLGELTRKSVYRWLTLHAGDFQSITDFRADIGPFFSDFSQEESEGVFNACIDPTLEEE